MKPFHILTAFSDKLHKFQDNLREAADNIPSELSTDNDQKKLEYSIALAVVFLTFGLWLFDFMKTQSYFSITREDLWVIYLLFSIVVVSVTSGITLIVHMLLGGFLLTKLKLDNFRRCTLLISDTLFEMSLLAPVIILIILLFYMPAAMTYYVNYWWMGYYMTITPLLILIIIIRLLIDGVKSEKNEVKTKVNSSAYRIKKFFIAIYQLMSIMTYVFIGFFVAIYLSDNIIDFEVHADKQIYGINESLAVISLKITTPVKEDIKGSIIGAVTDSQGKNRSFMLERISTYEFTGVLPLENLSVGNCNAKLEYNLVKPHLVDLNFLICNYSKPFPCSPFDELPVNLTGNKFVILSKVN